MQETKKPNLILKTFVSFLITFLIILIVAITIRAFTLNMKNTESAFGVFTNEYFEVIAAKIDSVASMFNIKRNSVSQYQINLISQSIEDYIGMIKYQNKKASDTFNPSKVLNQNDIQKAKETYYRMSLENPYLRSLTFFDMNGNMRLNLFSQKGFTVELNENLINEVKTKKSLVLHAQSENAFYIIQHIKNKNGEFVMASRNDYMFIPDIVAYYQINQKDFILRDAHNVTYKIAGSGKEVALAGNAKEKAASVIGKYAYYKTLDAFTINDVPSLSITMTEKVYPNYFELILIVITALMIVIFQKTISFIIAFMKKLMSNPKTEYYENYATKNSIEEIYETEYENKTNKSDDLEEDIEEYTTEPIYTAEPSAKTVESPSFLEKNIYSEITQNKKESPVKKYNNGASKGDLFSSFDNLLVSVINKTEEIPQETLKQKNESEEDSSGEKKKFKFQIDEI